MHILDGEVSTSNRKDDRTSVPERSKDLYFFDSSEPTISYSSNNGGKIRNVNMI